MERIISKAGSIFEDLPEPGRPPTLLHQLCHTWPLGWRQHLAVQGLGTLELLHLVLGVHPELDDVLVAVVLVLDPVDVLHPGRKTVVHLCKSFTTINYVMYIYLTSTSMRK